MKVLALLLTFITLSQALLPIHVKGTKFFTSDGKQFYVIGVDYQPTATSTDPLADVAGLNRDIPYLKALGVNAIRVYSTSSSNNHDAGMQLLNNAGIYVLLDATDSSFSVDANSPSWNTDIFSGIQAKIAAFIKYPNVFGFLAGNEVILTNAQTNAAPYIKAAVRDVKAYIKSLNSTALVGYAATDVPANDYLQPFLDCQSADESVDFYGINTYRWCNGDTYQTSGYAGFISTPYDRPVIFTEFGCNRVQPRTFDEIQAIYGSQMTDSLSGGFVYEWSQEANSYGLVSISGSTVTTLGDYDNLQSQLKKISPTYTTESAYTAPASEVVACPSRSSNWAAQSFPLPPTPDSTACSCMASSLSCVVSPSATVSQIQSAVSTACGSVSCAGITSDPSTASYGQYSMCSSVQMASYALNTYYSKYTSAQGKKACDFGGVGLLQTPGTCAGDATVAITESQSASESASVSQSESASASQSASVSESVSNSDGVSESQSASATKSATVSATKSATVSSSKTSMVSSSVPAGTVNKYQTDWDAAFSASSTTVPAIGLVIMAVIMILFN